VDGFEVVVGSGIDIEVVAVVDIGLRVVARAEVEIEVVAVVEIEVRVGLVVEVEIVVGANMKTNAQNKEDRIRQQFASKLGCKPEQVEFSCDCIPCGGGWTSNDGYGVTKCPFGVDSECSTGTIVYTEKHKGFIYKEDGPGRMAERVAAAIKEAQKRWEAR